MTLFYFHYLLRLLTSYTFIFFNLTKLQKTIYFIPWMLIKIQLIIYTVSARYKRSNQKYTFKITIGFILCFDTTRLQFRKRISSLSKKHIKILFLCFIFSVLNYFVLCGKSISQIIIVYLSIYHFTMYHLPFNK